MNSSGLMFKEFKTRIFLRSPHFRCYASGCSSCHVSANACVMTSSCKEPVFMPFSASAGITLRIKNAAKLIPLRLTACINKKKYLNQEQLSGHSLPLLLQHFLVFLVFIFGNAEKAHRIFYGTSQFFY